MAVVSKSCPWGIKNNNKKGAGQYAGTIIQHLLFLYETLAKTLQL